MTPPRQPRQQIPVEPQRRRLIDLTMPLPWLIGSFVAIVSGLFSLGWMAANQNAKLTQIIESQAKIEQRQTEISTRTDLLRDQLVELKQTQAIQAIRIGTLERDGTKK